MFYGSSPSATPDGPNSAADLWECLPISQETADFFSLGCRLPGEVRITAAVVDPYHLKEVNLKREADDEDAVVVDFDGVDAEPNAVESGGSRWTMFANSAFSGQTSETLGPRLNEICREHPSLLDDMKVRTIENHHFNFQRKHSDVTN